MKIVSPRKPKKLTPEEMAELRGLCVMINRKQTELRELREQVAKLRGEPKRIEVKNT